MLGKSLLGKPQRTNINYKLMIIQYIDKVNRIINIYCADSNARGQCEALLSLMFYLRICHARSQKASS